MFGPKRVTDNAGLIRLMKSADNGPLGKPRNRSVHSDKLIPQLWEPAAGCCDLSGYEPEVLRPCPACGEIQSELCDTCEVCDACIHCGGDPELPKELGPAHLCTFSMTHNTYEDRTCWMVRVKEGTPGAREVSPGLWSIEIWLDVEHGLLDQLTWSVRKEEIRRGADMTPEELTAVLEGTLR